MVSSNCSPRSTAYRCTLVIPTYNAGTFIGGTIQRLRRFTADNPDWCVLFVCDGCADDTAAQIAAALHSGPPSLQMECYERNRGKGYALRRGLSLARTPFKIYTDVDLAYDPDAALGVLRLLEGGADVALANRVDPASRFLISPQDFPSIYRRHRMSRAFNWWLRHMLPISALDTQAGLKGLTAAAWERLAPHIVSEGFFFDVELLAWSGAMNMAVAETPVDFRYVDPTTVRMVQHGWPMVMATLRLRRELRRGGPAPLMASPHGIVGD